MTAEELKAIEDQLGAEELCHEYKHGDDDHPSVEGGSITEVCTQKVKARDIGAFDKACGFVGNKIRLILLDNICHFKLSTGILAV